MARALVAWAAELAAGRCSAQAKSQLRARAAGAGLQLGLDSSRTQSTGELTVLATRGLDALDGYFSLYLPQLLLAAIVPLVVLVAVVSQDWISAAIIAFTIPLIPLFMALVGAATREKMDRQVRTLQRLAGHFLDVVAGLPTLKVFGRAKAQAASIRSDLRALPRDRALEPACDVSVLADPRAGSNDLRGAGRRGDRAAPDGRGACPCAPVCSRWCWRPRHTYLCASWAPTTTQAPRDGRRRAGIRGTWKNGLTRKHWQIREQAF